MEGRGPGTLPTFGALGLALLILSAGTVALYLGGPPAGAGGLQGVTEGQAATAAAPVVGSVRGGPWGLAGAYGLDSVAAASLDLGHVPNQGGCQPPLLASPNLSYGPYTGPYFQGEAALWILQYSSPGAETSLLVAVHSGRATLLSNTSWSGTLPACGRGPPSLPGGTLDSDASAIAAISTAAGRSYVRSIGLANASYILGWKGGVPVWSIVFDACAPTTSFTGHGYFAASVLATGGPTVLAAFGNENGCAG